EFAQPRVAPVRLNVLVAVVGVGAASARRRNEALGHQIADLPLCYSRECRKLANFHGSTFRQDYCRKRARLSSFFAKLLSKGWGHMIPSGLAPPAGRDPMSPSSC